MSYKRNYRNTYVDVPRRGTSAKSVLATIVIVALALAALVGINNVVTSETKTITPTFTIGAIDATGNYVESTTSIYTKELIEVEGLVTELAYDANVTYQVFFYDEDKLFVSATDADLTESSRFDIPEEAEYARIMITPDWETINADVEVEEDEEIVNEIKWYEVTKFASQLTITVARNTKDK